MRTPVPLGVSLAFVLACGGGGADELARVQAEAAQREEAAHAAEPAVVTHAPAFHTDSSGDGFTCAIGSCAGTFQGPGKLCFTTLGPGAQVAYAGRPAVAISAPGCLDPAADYVKTVRIADYLVDQPVDRQPLAIAFADGTHADGEIPVPAHPLSAYVSGVLATADRGPALFPGEAAKTGGDGSLWAGGTLYGTAAYATDIDRVLTVSTTVRDRSCGTYARSDGTTTAIVAHMTDAKATIYDRRTGKRLGSKAFAAPTVRCEDKLQDVGDPSSYYSQADLGAWAMGFVAHGSGAVQKTTDISGLGGL
jgi:hypothetical protein